MSEELFKFSPTKKLAVYDVAQLVPENSPNLKVSCVPFDFTDQSADPLKLAHTLFEAMFREHGVGLTANQVGRTEAVFTIGFEEANKQVFFNPEIIEESLDQISADEGCLSYPGLFLKVKRPSWIKLKYQHVNSEWREETYSGFTARIICHEMMHIKGELFTSVVPSLSLMLAKEKRTKSLKKKSRLKI